MSLIILTFLFVKLSAQATFTNFTSADGLVSDDVSGGVCVDQSNVNCLTENKIA